MLLDPSALFSVLFIEEESFPDIGEDTKIVNLNYTMLGDQPLLETTGIWFNVTVTIPHNYDNEDIEDETANNRVD